MSGKHPLFLLVSLLLVSLLAGAVSAQTRPMQVQAIAFPGESCPTQPAVYGFEITNLGSDAETYHFAVSAYADYITYSAPDLFLAPGQKGRIFLFFRTPADVYGDFTFDFIITADTAQFQATIPLVQRVNACYDYRVELGQLKKTDGTYGFTSVSGNEFPACSEAQMVLPVLVTNQAPIANEFTFELQGPDWGNLNGNLLRLEPGQKGMLLITLRPEEAITKGRYGFTLFSTSAKGKLQKGLPFFIDLDQCHDFSVVLAKHEAEICCKDTDFQGIVINNGKDDENFTLSIAGDDTASLDKDTLSIPAGKNASFTLSIHPACTDGSVPKEQQLSPTVYAELDKGSIQIRRSDSLSVTVHPVQTCYDVDVRNVDSFFNSRVISLDKGKQNTTLAVKNIGTADATYAVKLEGPLWAWTDQRSITIPSGGETTLSIITDIGEEVPEGSTPLTLTLTPKGEDIAFKFDFDAETGKGQGFFSGLSAYLFYVLIAIFLLIVIIFLLNRSMKKTEKKDSVVEVPLYVSDKDLEKAKKEEARRLKEEKRQAARASLAAKAVKEIKETKAKREKKKSPSEKAKEPTRFPWATVILLLLILLLAGLLYYFYNSIDYGDNVTGFEPTKAIGMPTTGGLGIGMKIAGPNESVAVLANQTPHPASTSNITNVTSPEEAPVVVPPSETNKTNKTNKINESAEAGEGMTLSPSNETVGETNITEGQLPVWKTATYEKGFTYQILDKNTPLVIDLSEHFKDPDNDTLTYGYTGGENMIVDINGSVVTLTPVWDFLGRDRIVFTATDGKSEPIESPEVILEVQEPSSLFDTQFFGYLNAYGWYILLGVVILVLVILILRMTEEDERPKKRPGRPRKRATTKNTGRKRLKKKASKK
ncbi:MAG: hypothetical protein GXP63_06890 [DPANN group archaeon]|nr:hypothetical protein [DPANN group archaeon]